MSIANAIVTSMKTHKRKKSDFYPTPYEATAAIIPILRQLGVVTGAVIAEPACGNGAMARILERDGGYRILASDLRHTGYGRGGWDYLAEDSWVDWFAEHKQIAAVVTNPPFDVAEEFIRRAVSQVPVVAMLLKVNYWNSIRGLKFYDEGFAPTARHDITWRLAFLEEERGKAPLMDCAWYIWKRGDPPIDRPLPRPKGVKPLDTMLSVMLADNRFARGDLTEALHGIAGT